MENEEELIEYKEKIGRLLIAKEIVEELWTGAGKAIVILEFNQENTQYAVLNINLHEAYISDAMDNDYLQINCQDNPKIESLDVFTRGLLSVQAQSFPDISLAEVYNILKLIYM